MDESRAKNIKGLENVVMGKSSGIYYEFYYREDSSYLEAVETLIDQLQISRDCWVRQYGRNTPIKARLTAADIIMLRGMKIKV